MRARHKQTKKLFGPVLYGNKWSKAAYAESVFDKYQFYLDIVRSN